MNEVMKDALLKVCEKYAGSNIDVNIDFAYDIITAFVKSTETKIDDMFLPSIILTKSIVKEALYKLADKIDGVEGNIEVNDANSTN